MQIPARRNDAQKGLCKHTSINFNCSRFQLLISARHQETNYELNDRLRLAEIAARNDQKSW